MARAIREDKIAEAVMDTETVTVSQFGVTRSYYIPLKTLDSSVELQPGGEESVTMARLTRGINQQINSIGTSVFGDTLNEQPSPEFKACEELGNVQLGFMNLPGNLLTIEIVAPLTLDCNEAETKRARTDVRVTLPLIIRELSEGLRDCLVEMDEPALYDPEMVERIKRAAQKCDFTEQRRLRR